MVVLGMFFNFLEIAALDVLLLLGVSNIFNQSNESKVTKLDSCHINAKMVERLTLSVEVVFEVV